MEPSAPPEYLESMHMIEYEHLYQEQFIYFKYIDSVLKIQLDNTINNLIKSTKVYSITKQSFFFKY